MNNTYFPANKSEMNNWLG